jgi:hypothetical protein
MSWDGSLILVGVFIVGNQEETPAVGHRPSAIGHRP